jgi:hypothetical protein
MSRTLWNFWLDVLLLCTLLVAMWCVFVLRFVFPPGTLANGWVLWGWSYDQWFQFQFSVWALFALLILVHLMLHWTWVCGVISSKLLRGRDDTKRQWSDGERTLVGVGLLVVLCNLLGIGFAVAVLMVQGPS